MTDGNPLVATPQDDTTALTGLGMFEAANELGQSLARGDWLDAGMNAVGFGMEALGMAMDPVGTLLQYGVSWVIEHCEPLQDCLDKLAGNPPVIRSYGQTWQNVGEAVGQAAEDFGRAVEADLTSWQGDAAQAYRAKAAEQADAMAAAGVLANAIGIVVQVVGELVAMIRETVREIIAILVSFLIELIIEEIATVGLATPVVVEQGIAAIARAGGKITRVLTKLMRSLAKLAKKLPELVKLLGDVIRKLLRRGQRGTPNRRSPDVNGSPDGSTSPSGTPGDGTSPSGGPDGPGGRPDGPGGRSPGDDGSPTSPSHAGDGRGSPPPPRSAGPPQTPGDGRPIHSRYPDGTPVYEGEQPGRIREPDPAAEGRPHTRIQWDEHNGRPYKAREYDENGHPIRDIDFTHPTYPNGRPRPDHTAPEEHPYIPNDPNNPRAGFKRGKGRPLSPPEE